MKFGMGQSVRRTEDVRFVTGHGQYTDDISLPGQAHGVFLRSPYAHARLTRLDVAAARSAPGVLGVLTHDDIAAAGAGRMIGLVPFKNRDGSALNAVAQPLLAAGTVRYVGEPVALVIAESVNEAKDAIDLIEAEFEALPAAGTIAAASADGAPQLWDEAPGNLCIDWDAGDEAAADAAFANAAHVVELDLIQNRVVPNAMEPRAANGLYDPGTDSFTLYTSSQGASGLRDRIAGFMMNIAPEKLRVVTPDVGGGFGMKMFAYKEQALVLFAAKAVGRPVKWTGERAEAFMADAHGRDLLTHAALALDGGGRILGLKVHSKANLGAFLSQFAVFIPTLGGARVFGGVYRVPAGYARTRCYYTNTAPVDAYRGAGRPEATYMIERLMDLAAAKLGLDALEIRRRNLVAADAMPFTNWMGIAIDSGEFHRNLDDAAAKADWDGFAARRAASQAKGRLRGRGLIYYVEITGAAPVEVADIRFTDNGGVEVTVGTQSNGQGHETTFAQIVAERLGIPFEQISVKMGDTGQNVHGGGTGGSRSLHMAGGAILKASDAIIEKARTAAGHMLEAAEGDIEFAVTETGGTLRVAGTDRAVSLIAVALAAKRGEVPGLETGLDDMQTFEAGAGTFPNGCHVAEVEIDRDTGRVILDRYVVVDDFGRVLNPMIVAGQVHGGIAQGVGQALMEECVYEPDSGQLITGSFMDYCMPRADDLPDIDFSYNEVATESNPLGIKGCGEAGTVGAMPAVIGAVCDALSPFGVTHVDMPASPEKIWRLMRRAPVAAAAE